MSLKDKATICSGGTDCHCTTGKMVYWGDVLEAAKEAKKEMRKACIWGDRHDKIFDREFGK